MISPPFAKESFKENKIPQYFSVILTILVVLLYIFIPGIKDFFDESLEILTSANKQRIAIWVDGFSWFGPLLLILAMVAQMFLVIIPSIALIVVSVLAYGPIYGSAIAFVGVYLASSVGYFLGRFLGPVVIGKIIGQRSSENGSSFLKKYGFWAIFVTRVSPFLYNDAVSLISGILKMEYWKFIWANIAGIAPLVLLIAILGDSTEELKSGLAWSSFISLMIFGAYLFIDKTKKRNSI